MDNLTENTLKKFGKDFQTKSIACLLNDRAFLERIFDILSPDYWELDPHKWVVLKIMEYFPKYKEIPSPEVLAIEIKKLENDVLSASLVDSCKKVYDNFNSPDLKYIKEEFLMFCKNQKLKSAIIDSHAYLKNGDYEKIWETIHEASKAGMERNIGHNYMEDIESRYQDDIRNVVKTNWAIIDGHLDGGLGNGELGFICAPAGSGKSWMLTHLGAAGMKQGKNVMHFTLELTERYVGRRYDSCFSGIKFQDVKFNKDRVKESLKDVTGKLFIKYFPLKTVSPQSLMSHIEQLKIIQGIDIDLVIVDYADLLRPSNISKGASSYEIGGAVYEELRSVIGQLNIRGWTASQTQRSAHEEEIIGAQGVSESYKKIMTGDFIMSLSRTMADKTASTGRVTIIKSRFGSDGDTYPCSFDASCGKVEIFDAKSIEGMEVLRKVKNSEENTKDIIRKRWNEVKNKSDDETY